MFYLPRIICALIVRPEPREGRMRRLQMILWREQNGMSSFIRELKTDKVAQKQIEINEIIILRRLLLDSRYEIRCGCSQSTHYMAPPTHWMKRAGFWTMRPDRLAVVGGCARGCVGGTAGGLAGGLLGAGVPPGPCPRERRPASGGRWPRSLPGPLGGVGIPSCPFQDFVGAVVARSKRWVMSVTPYPHHRAPL